MTSSLLLLFKNSIPLYWSTDSSSSVLSCLHVTEISSGSAALLSHMLVGPNPSFQLYLSHSFLQMV